MSMESDERCSLVFQALADPTRLRILQMLNRGELCVSEICAHFDMTQPSISHHLEMLRRADLVTREKRGREMFYRFNGDAIIECCGKQFRLLDIIVERQ